MIIEWIRNWKIARLPSYMILLASTTLKLLQAITKKADGATLKDVIQKL